MSEKLPACAGMAVWRRRLSVFPPPKQLPQHRNRVRGLRHTPYLSSRIPPVPNPPQGVSPQGGARGLCRLNKRPSESAASAQPKPQPVSRAFMPDYGDVFQTCRSLSGINARPTKSRTTPPPCDARVLCLPTNPRVSPNTKPRAWLRHTPYPTQHSQNPFFRRPHPPTASAVTASAIRRAMFSLAPLWRATKAAALAA